MMFILILLIIIGSVLSVSERVKSFPENEVGVRTIHLVAYSNRIIEESCISMQTAILNGWTYNLLTGDSGQIINTDRSALQAQITPQFKKIFIFNASLNSFLPDDLIIFADAYDVIIQGNYRKFVRKIYQRKKHFWDYQNTLLYNAEDNCHPFNVVNEK